MNLILVNHKNSTTADILAAIIRVIHPSRSLSSSLSRSTSEEEPEFRFIFVYHWNLSGVFKLANSE